MRIGIFFGGPSREREISFAGGRTVYDNLDKRFFQPIPIFVDSFGYLVLIDWPYVYKGTIRDFYPSDELNAQSTYSHYIESFVEKGSPEHFKELKKLGTPIDWNELSHHIDFGFLALHGSFGEDGTIQALLSNQGIPYSGSGILSSAIGINKAIQKQWMKSSGFTMPNMLEISRDQWLDQSKHWSTTIRNEFKGKLVIRPAHQGSSIGVSILDHPDMEAVEKAMNAAFFIQKWTSQLWNALHHSKKAHFLKSLPDVKEGLGFPLKVNDQWVHRVEDVQRALENLAEDEVLTLEAQDGEPTVIVEEFIDGREFSCIVIRHLDGTVIALPPTEIVKQGQLYDYRSKYLPGFSRKVTPIELDTDDIRRIMGECEKLFTTLHFGCYARIDGFFTPAGDIILNDPNTTSGMMPSSFFFHQAAEIGLSPSEFLTFIIHSSLQERRQENYHWPQIESQSKFMSHAVTQVEEGQDERIPIGVIFGGYSFERHISVESGRNIFEKMNSSGKYRPTPLFLQGHGNEFELIELPIPLLLKDNADDIRDKISHFSNHPILEEIREKASTITEQYAYSGITAPRKVSWTELKERFPSVFIALHGRPGEDGAIQRKLDELGILYNGSSAQVSSITINKFDTLQLLGSYGFPVAEQMIVEKSDYVEDPERWLNSISGKFDFPLIAKPVDDGCSSAVMKLDDTGSLQDYLNAIFRNHEELSPQDRENLSLSWNEEFPAKQEVLIESLIRDQGADLFVEITCGVMSIMTDRGPVIQVFEPSEAIASTSILSLEEKFLAGQGLNITPARLAVGKWDYAYVAERVKKDLHRACEILGIEGYARIDAFVRVFDDGRVETIIIEVNSLPGMTPATCIYHQAAIEGLKPFEFIDKIMTFAKAKAKTEA